MLSIEIATKDKDMLLYTSALTRGEMTNDASRDDGMEMTSGMTNDLPQ
jgi:hypothetical protein